MNVFSRKNTSLGMTISPLIPFLAVMMFDCLSVKENNHIMSPKYYESSDFDNVDRLQYNDESDGNIKQIDPIQDIYNYMSKNTERQTASDASDAMEESEPLNNDSNSIESSSTRQNDTNDIEKKVKKGGEKAAKISYKLNETITEHFKEKSAHIPDIVGAISYQQLADFDYSALPTESSTGNDFRENFLAALPRVQPFPVKTIVMGVDLPPFLNAEKLEGLDNEQKIIIQSIRIKICFTKFEEKGNNTFCKKTDYKGGQINLEYGYYIVEVSAKNPDNIEDTLLYGLYSITVASNPKSRIVFEYSENDGTHLVEFTATYDIEPYECHVWYVKGGYTDEVLKAGGENVELDCLDDDCSCSGGTYVITKRIDGFTTVITGPEYYILPRKINESSDPEGVSSGTIFAIIFVIIVIIIGGIGVCVYLKRSN